MTRGTKSSCAAAAEPGAPSGGSGSASGRLLGERLQWRLDSPLLFFELPLEGVSESSSPRAPLFPWLTPRNLALRSSRLFRSVPS
ncbi:hypothetical protein EYF80_015264 [Liparis tanakae]|uniref:Uncharacterized protein n=1 Tax=Liparis tanakae TaxID=230148 RepID=A0A4Z2IAZ7_9TELE|nr:hypothetical protein EYF80_015264 [Liparis tanakae]